MTLAELIERAKQYLPAAKLPLVEKAYAFAAGAHEGQVRKSGDPYIEHPLQVAFILAEQQFDASTLAAALLHDVPENCDISIDEIKERFGPEVAKLVDGTTKLGKLSFHAPSGADRAAHAESLRKMLVAMAQDLRVVFIKLADRLHNMRTLKALSPEMQRSIAQETLEIYTPLAHRLGIWGLKWNLEDLSFRYLEPEKYRHVASLIAARRAQREEYIAKIIKVLEAELKRVGIKAEISGRPKHIYSIYQKMQRYEAMGKDFDDIYDLLALRILVSTVADCYNALGVIHSLWRPVPGEFDDFIANPKPNGYQALHTAVMSMGNLPLEVQIRTRQMHHVAEYGIAAHWRYKEGEAKDLHFEEKISWLRQLIEWHRELSGAEEFLESVKTDIFMDQVFVYTPKGEIIDLPKGATPLDFAYRVHTELGNRCIGAKANGKLVPLNYQLGNGDVVEIVASKGDKGPSRDWLNPHLNYTKTSHARTKIRQWFSRQERAENIERGREMLDKEMRHLGIRPTEREELARMFNYDSLDDFLAAIGYGGVSTHQIALKLSAEPPPPQVKPEVAPPKPPQSAVRVLGVGDLVTHLARCCHPVPGDKIIGYVTRSRGVTIHRKDCYNIVHEDEKERLISVDWEPTDALFPVNILVEAWDRVGLIRDITTIVAEEGLNITTMTSTPQDGRKVTQNFTLQARDLAQLSRLMTKIDGIRGVIGVSRIGDEAAAKPKSSS
ncbi:MAG: bifunctional (p)ppGpp synthetase/guanosine-3',5'-bis(diphosphate) 3'-pyrophosphohydrolase [Dehalococcoidia bacterium]|jgi:GTP pyrophosphokinase